MDGQGDPTLLRRKSRDHVCAEFYVAMLLSLTYEEYLAKVGVRTVDRPDYKEGATNGRDEILYCRRSGWIVDGD
jgi:hypothetical protein